VKPRRTLLAVVLAAVAASLLLPSASSAFVIGVGDQSPTLFDDPWFQQLAPKRVRYITPYDAALKANERPHLDAWMQQARAAGVEVVIAFNPPGTMRCPNVNGARGCRPVSGAQYKKAFQAFRKRYPWVRIYQPWNEVNNLTQPTALYPDAVVSYYQIVKQNCRGCTVLGADLQDLPNMVSYGTKLINLFRKRRIPVPKLWGLHNYTDNNRFIRDANSNTRKAVRLLPGKIWLTETGGIYRFQPQNARQTFRPDLARQKRALQAVFTQATRYRNKITRVYLYHWFGSGTDNRWDSGVIDLTGRPRPAYDVLKRYARNFK
jgi:hypothetical protein